MVLDALLQNLLNLVGIAVTIKPLMQQLMICIAELNRVQSYATCPHGLTLSLRFLLSMLAQDLTPIVLPYGRRRYGERIDAYGLHQARSWGQTHLQCGHSLGHGL